MEAAEELLTLDELRLLVAAELTTAPLELGTLELDALSAEALATLATLAALDRLLWPALDDAGELEVEDAGLLDDEEAGALETWARDDLSPVSY